MKDKLKAGLTIALTLVFALGVLFLLTGKSELSSVVVAGQKPGDDDYENNLRMMKKQEAAMVRAKDSETRFDELRKTVDEQSLVRVIVRLRASFTPEGVLGKTTAVNAQRFLIKQAGDRLINNLYGYDPQSVKTYDSLPYVTLMVNGTGLEALRASELVIDIQEDKAHFPELTNSTLLIGAVKARSSNFRGQGQTVAILDTGVDKNHPFLASKVVSEACYSTNSSQNSVSSLCPGGLQESTSVNSGIPCPDNVRGCNHGTHVAGIAAGRGPSFSGVAPEANIIAINVFSRFSLPSDCSPHAAPCVRAFESDIISGLNRVYSLRNSLSVAAVNMSLGSDKFTSNCDSQKQAIKLAIDNLRSVGIATVISSGNGSYTDSLGFPACISTSISVGATQAIPGQPEAVASYSNSANFLSLLAPGSGINSSVPGGGYAIFDGTSMAAPHVAGSFALLKSALPTATVTRMLTALTTTGVQTRDSRNGIVKPRIQVDKAIESLGPLLIGNLDRADCTTIAGWVADRNRPNVALSVRIYDGSVLVATVPANSYRQDIAALMGDGGNHGFSISTPAVFRDGRSHTLRVQFDTVSQNIPSGQRTFSCAPVYDGYIDQLDCNFIVGWAADRNRPNQVITARIFDGTTLVSTVTASQFRPDLVSHLGDNGAHGFRIATPAVFRDGKPHSIIIRYEASNTAVPNGSKTLSCGPVYVGNLDAATCTSIIGWAADRNRLDTSITVRLFDGENLVQTILANVQRNDVGAVIGDNGRHGFDITTPSVFRDGKPHSVRVTFEGSTTRLSSSPRTLQCSTR